MRFARKVWKLLVAIKDALVLAFLLLFFGLLYAALAMRPTPGKVSEGALVVHLDGTVVEETADVDTLDVLLAQGGQVALPEETRARDVARALRLAATDRKVKLVAIDLSRFVGGGFVHLREIGAAMDAVRAAGKPVLTYADAYADDGTQLAAHASEAWVNPMGGAMVTGPGGNQLYFASLLNKLKIEAHVFRVGTYKSFVEPYTRDGPSPAALQASTELYGDIWRAWQADVQKARPKANLALVTRDPVGWLRASGGDLSRASKAAGLIDRTGTPTDFADRVAQLSGNKAKASSGEIVGTPLATYLAAHPESTAGSAIGVVTIAGNIVDGDAGPGTAGGDRIAEALDDARDSGIKALVIRIDSPGGSVLASERIRRSIERYRDKGIPVVASMANYAASGGYWVSTPAQYVFAEPGTITGSIGVFGILPSFERALTDLGVNAAGVKTTALSGQPDVLGGLSPEVEQMLQIGVEDVYGKFIGLVAKARHRTPEQIDPIAQGRVWTGGRAKQLGLVDAYGGLDIALAYAAGQAKLGNKPWHAKYIGRQEDPLNALLMQMYRRRDAAGGDFMALAARRQRSQLASALGRAEAMLSGQGMQAMCLECPGLPAVRSKPADSLVSAMLMRLAAMAGS